MVLKEVVFYLIRFPRYLLSRCPIRGTVYPFFVQDTIVGPYLLLIDFRTLNVYACI